MQILHIFSLVNNENNVSFRRVLKSIKMAVLDTSWKFGKFMGKSMEWSIILDQLPLLKLSMDSIQADKT